MDKRDDSNECATPYINAWTAYRVYPSECLMNSLILILIRTLRCLSLCLHQSYIFTLAFFCFCISWVLSLCSVQLSVFYKFFVRFYVGRLGNFIPLSFYQAIVLHRWPVDQCDFFFKKEKKKKKRKKERKKTNQYRVEYTGHFLYFVLLRYLIGCEPLRKTADNLKQPLPSCRTCILYIQYGWNGTP